MQRAIKELYVTRGDIQAIGKRSLLVTPLGGKVFWVMVRFADLTTNKLVFIGLQPIKPRAELDSSTVLKQIFYGYHPLKFEVVSKE